nr:hypothetical protein [Methylobacterium sp.]
MDRRYARHPSAGSQQLGRRIDAPAAARLDLKQAGHELQRVAYPVIGLFP